jgi:hypothetical protein
VPAARSPERNRLRRGAAGAALFVGLAAGAAGCTRGGGPTILSKTAPDAGHAAVVRMVRCDGGWCQELAIGDRPDAVQTVATLRFGTERCDEIVWTRDGRRVGFLVNGHQLRLFDAHTHSPAGQLDLVPADSNPTTRIARGVTISDNGAAITFDDCPRDRSGCRPGMVAMK